MVNLNNPIDNLTNDGLGELLDELPLWSAAFGQELLAHIRFQKGMNVLDIGCGSGFPLITLAQRLGDTCKIYGLEPNEVSFARAKNKIDLLHLDNISLSKSTAEEMNFNDGFFDMICSNNGLNNVQDIELSFNNCRRVAKNKCLFIYTMNLQGTMPIFYETFINVVKAIPDVNIEKKIDRHIHNKRKPLDYLLDLTERADFKILKTIERHFYMNYIDGTAFLNDFLIRSWFMPLWKELIPNKYQQYVFDEIEKQLNIIAEENDYLMLNIPFICIIAEKNC